MYTQHFGFCGSPFADTTDLDCFYTNPTYRKAHHTLLTGIREHKGFLLLTGETGTGKTTLLRRLMKDVEASGHSVFFDSTSLATATIDDLLYFICTELGLFGDDNGRVAKLRRFSAYLNALVSKGGTGVLLIDEAQHLNDDVLGGLRLIAPLDMQSEQLLLQIVLVGRPELEQRLQQPELRPIHQRVAMRCRLGRLQDEEIAAYIQHRLQTVGCERTDLFTAEALQHITHASCGIPRLINNICDNALLLAYGEQSHSVSAECIDEAVEKLRLDTLATAGSRSGSVLPLHVSSEALVQSPVTLPQQPAFLSQSEGDTSNSSSRWGITAVRSRLWSSLILGLVFVLGVGWLLQEQRASLLSLLRPPAPTIMRSTPITESDQPLVLPEGQAQTFTVETSRSQPETLRYVWFVDEKEVGTGTSWTYHPQFDEGGGRKLVTVRITDPHQQTVEQRWNVHIQDVNRPPQVTAVSPQERTVEVQKGASSSFSVTMEDPDAGQRVEATWFLDEEKVAQGPRWTFSPQPALDEGYHTVKMTGTDSAGAMVERQWIVTVTRGVPDLPRIIRTQPETSSVTIKEGQGLTFTVEVANPQPELRYVWLLDGKEQVHGQRWTYQPQYTEGGQERTVTVQVRHPVAPAQERSWKVAIQEVNRPPVIATAEPRSQIVKVQKGKERRFAITTTDPDLNDRLSAVWKLDGKEVAQGQTWTFTSPVDETKVQHTVTVSVVDQNGMQAERQWRVTVAAVEVLPLQIMNVQPALSELSVSIGQPVVFAVEVPKDRTEVQYVWLLDGQEQSRRRTWTYIPQAQDSKTNKAVTVRVQDRDNQSVERSWQLRIQAMAAPPVPPPPPPVAAPPPPVLSESDVRAWVEAQRRALEDRDVSTLIELGALNSQQAERAREILAQYKNFRVAFRNLAVQVEGDRAEVSFSRIDTIEGTEVPHTDRKRFLLQRGTDGRIKARPQ